MIADGQVITIQKAEYIEDYKISLLFNDNTERVVDFYPFLSHSLNPLIRKYLNITNFKKFHVDNGDLEWYDYDLCFPIANLYENDIKP
jgi:hypothetical protein